MPEPATTPEPPYYAVIFTSVRTPADPEGYEQMAERMVELAREQPGFLGVESTRGSDGLGITVSYWASEAALRLGSLPARATTARGTLSRSPTHHVARIPQPIPSSVGSWVPKIGGCPIVKYSTQMRAVT